MIGVDGRRNYFCQLVDAGGGAAVIGPPIMPSNH